MKGNRFTAKFHRNVQSEVKFSSTCEWWGNFFLFYLLTTSSCWNKDVNIKLHWMWSIFEPFGILTEEGIGTRNEYSFAESVESLLTVVQWSCVVTLSPKSAVVFRRRCWTTVCGHISFCCIEPMICYHGNEKKTKWRTRACVVKHAQRRHKDPVDTSPTHVDVRPHGTQLNNYGADDVFMSRARTFEGDQTDINRARAAIHVRPTDNCQ
jgi:hypothetical protein